VGKAIATLVGTSTIPPGGIVIGSSIAAQISIPAEPSDWYRGNGISLNFSDIRVIFTFICNTDIQILN
jgi:hypothetical protein